MILKSEIFFSRFTIPFYDKINVSARKIEPALCPILNSAFIKNSLDKNYFITVIHIKRNYSGEAKNREQ